jgi:4-amino-4-deoxy-L-arabinose transferase-like glycosyltransferase
MASSSKKSFLIPILLVVAGAIMFLPFLGKVHLFDWDEINFAECAREMIAAKQYFLVTINYLPFWEKPPLFIWMQALSMKLFGVSDYAARFPNALCGIVTMLVLYNTGKLLKDKRFGLLWVLVYVGSLLPHFYFKSGIIDPWFNLFIFSGVYFFMRFQMRKKNMMQGSKMHLVLSAFFIGLAMLTKGPVAFLIFSLTTVIYWWMERRWNLINFRQGVVYLLVVFAAGGAWFASEALTGHWDTIKQFIAYQIRLFNTQDSGHGGPFYYHFIILLIGCFPASIFAIRGMMIKPQDDKMREAARWMGILFWVVLILFSIVKTKILHYSSLCYYPLTFFAALALYELFENAAIWKKWMGWTIGILGGTLVIALALLPVAGMNKQALIPYIKDPFAVANLDANVTWAYTDSIVGFILLASLISGFIFIKRGRVALGAVAFFVGTLITTNTALIIIAPKIEQITQESAIDFYQSLKGKDVYVTTIDFKSYAHYFYSDEQPWKDSRCTDNDWLLHGNIDKPAYFVCKVNRANDIEKENPQLKELYRKNGFVFLQRALSSQ